ncbi:hypothetical protein [Chishuiella sp.]|uniref:hypothetical protein n=1 Tax=Chishuiella sp. TaxID=1969467 RepID=UPI0028AB2D0E|nr:hypothetical protein [Chishuiella sp.]
MSDLITAAQKILDLTNYGLEIIQKIYPDAIPGRNFKVRADERTASASIKIYKDRYKMTDFGGTVKNEDCFGLYALDKNISYSEAIVEIGRELQNDRGIQIFEETREFYKYEFRQCNKEDFEHNLNEQGFHFITKSFTDYELDILGPFVKEEHCLSVNLHSLVEFSYYNQEKKKVFTFRSTDKFPILAFINENDNKEKWLKIYMPKGAKKWSDDGKDRRFRYLGNKPKSFVFGLDRVKKAFNKGFEEERQKIADKKEIDVSDVKDSDIDFKLERVVLATGGSDGINFLSLGEYPIWFNSETEKPDRFLIKKLKKYAYEVVLVPDADETGKRIGRELALSFLSVRTLWLDQFFTQKSHKDFKDYMRSQGRRPIKEVVFNVQKMLNLSMPAQFWETSVSKEGRVSYNFHHMYAFYFLRLNGFCRIDDPSKKDGYYFARVQGYVVEELKTTQSIKDYFRNFLLAKQHELGVKEIPHALLNMMITSQKITDSHLANMHNRTLDFKNYTPDSQFFFIGNRCFKVDANGTQENFKFDNYVLKSQLIDSLIKDEVNSEISSYDIKSNLEIESPYFKISKLGNDLYDIEILKNDCDYLNYLIQTSRVYWEKERAVYIEKGFKEEDFYERSKFKIKSNYLSEEENREQVQHLVNKIFTFGYLAHRFKDPTKAWSPFALDNAVLEDDVAEGGAGKSLFFESMRYFMGVHDVDGKGDFDDKFLFEGVDVHTGLMIVDDVQRNFDFKRFYSATTGKMTVNVKFESKVKISYQNSPKIVFTSNYSLRDRSGSSARRQLIMGFSDYYHAKNEDRKAREPKDDFGYTLYTDWNSTKWFEFLNFVFQTTSFYLGCEEKIEAPGGNILLRSYISEMGRHFQDWADRYIPTISGLTIVKDEVLKNVQESKSKYLSELTSAGLKKKLNAWCKVNNYELEDRLMVNIPLVDKYGNVVYEGSKPKMKTTEHIRLTFIEDKDLEEEKENDFI